MYDSDDQGTSDESDGKSLLKPHATKTGARIEVEYENTPEEFQLS